MIIKPNGVAYFVAALLAVAIDQGHFVAPFCLMVWFVA